MALLACIAAGPEVPTLEAELRGQFRYTHEVGGRPSHSVALRRARGTFTGRLRPSVGYKVQLAFSPDDLGFGERLQSPVLDLLVDFDRNPWVAVRVGRAKLPLSRERLVSSAELQLADRSLANDEIDPNRDVGVALHSRDLGRLGWVRYDVGAYLGEGLTLRPTSRLAPMIVSRVDVTPLGSFAHDVHSDLERRRRPKLSIGVAHLVQFERQHQLAGDATLLFRGLSFNGQVMARVADTSGRDALGWFSQLAWLIPRVDVEVATRYGQLHPVRQSSVRRRHEVGGGLNLGFEDHRVRLQMDIIRAWTPGAAGPSNQARLQLDVRI